MMLNEIRNKVLGGEKITVEEARWLSCQAEKQDLYDAAHEITRVLASRNSICVPLSMLNPVSVLRIVNGAHSLHIIKQKRMFMIWLGRKNVCAMLCITKRREYPVFFGDQRQETG